MEQEEPDSPVRDRIRRALEGRPEVVFAYIFGSRGSPRAPVHAESDFDVAVYLREGRGDLRSGRFGDFWSELHSLVVKAAAPIAGLRDRGGAPEGVDLVILNDAPPLLADRVARRGGLLFSRSESARIRWLVRTKSRYCDRRPLRELLDGTVSARLRSGRFGRPPTDSPRGDGGGAGEAARESGPEARGEDGGSVP